MANRYFLNIGANYNSTANWSATSGGAGGASVPTNADDVFFDANSGNCTVNVASVAKSVNFTGYTNTITMTSTLTVSGSVTLVAAMTIAGASGLTINATGTFTSNGKTWPNALTFSANITLADNLSVSGLLSTTGVITISGTFTINAAGGVSIGNDLSQGTGTTTLNLTGGTLSRIAGSLGLNTNLNGNITISGLVAYRGILTYVSGTITTTGSTLSITGTTTLSNVSSITWNNFTNGGATITLGSDLNINGLLSIAGTFNGVFNINVSGGLTVTSTTTIGQATLNLLGGIWSGDFELHLNTNINGNITVSGSVRYRTGTLTYVSGTVTTTGSTLNIPSSCTLNTSGITWNNISVIGGGATTTLTSDLNVNGLFTISSGLTVNGTFNINANGGITLNSLLVQGTGTTTLNLLGGTWSTTSVNGILRINTVINGNVTISGNVYYNTGTLTYTSGTVTHINNSTLNINASTTLNTSGMSWNRVASNVSTMTLTLLSDLNINGLLDLVVILTVNGTFNINCAGGLSLFGASGCRILQGTGTTTLNLTGGTVSMDNVITINTNINGNISIGVFVFSKATLTYLSGTITGAKSLITQSFTFGTPTLNTGGMTWGTHTFSGNMVLTSNLNLGGLLTVSGDNGVFSGTFSVNCSGGLKVDNVPLQKGSGSPVVNLLGGTWSHNTTQPAQIDININGNITISGTVYYNTGTLTYTSGTVTTTGSTINIGAATTIAVNNSGLTLNNITATANVTFSGTNGCTINGTFTCTTAGTTHIFASTRTYTINALNIAGTNASRVTIRSSTGGSKALINLSSIQSEYYLNVTDINGSGGSAGYTFGGTVTNSDNWNASTILYYVGTVNFSSTSSWSPYSGGVPIGSISAPASTDDIRFDANSVNNCTMNVAGVCKSVNFTGYVGTITMSNTLTVSGSVTLAAGMGVAGTAALIVNATATLTSNTKTWSAGLSFSGTITVTLADNLNVSETVIFQTGVLATTTLNGNSLIAQTGATIRGNFSTLQGTTLIKFVGTSTLTNVGNNVIHNNITFDAGANTITITNTTNNLSFTTGTITYTSGTMDMTNANNIAISGSTLNTGGMTWKNINFSGGNITLLSNLNINGLLTISGAITVNGTFSINAAGGISGNTSIAQGTGTTTLNLTGGTWNGGGIGINMNINGNITISGSITFYNGKTLTYISGNVVTTGSTLTLSAASVTLNTSGMTWNNITIPTSTNITINLTSDLNIGGLFTTPSTADTVVNGAFSVNFYGGINFVSSGFLGSATFNFYGGTYSGSGSTRNNTNIRGNITLSGTTGFFNATLTYVNGVVTVSRGHIFSISTGTFINMDKINFRTVTVAATATITMNRFFSGSALVPTRIQSTGTNYTIAFQDGFEKITKFIKISNCTVLRPSQLLCITDKSNKGGNVGIRYINQSPNGIAKNAPTSPNPMAYGLPSFLDSDPNFITG